LSSFTGKKFRVYSANAFVSSVIEDSLYAYVGRSLAWTDETSPPSANDDSRDFNKIWDNMAGAVRITRNQVALGVKRNDWLTGSVYGKYHHANTSLGDNYYALAGVADRDVYLCLDNNGDAPSTSKPNHKNFSPKRESDGYLWKYMYSIPSVEFTKFATSNVIPVYNNINNQRSSRLGAIESLTVSANATTGVGTKYRGSGFSNGTSGVSISNGTIFTTIPSNYTTNELKILADAGLAVHDDYYINTAFYVTSGRAKGTYRTITDSKKGSDHTTTNLVFSTAMSGVANGDHFVIGPAVEIPDDLQGRKSFRGYADVNSEGKVTRINVVHSGLNYANGDVSVLINGDYLTTSGSFDDGSGAEADMMLAPSYSHGFDIPYELDAKFVIISPETLLPRDDQTGQFIGYQNEIRQFGLISRPVDSYTNLAARKDSYDQRTTVYFAHPTSVPFKQDQVVYDTGSGTEKARAIVYDVCGDTGKQYVTLTNVQGIFQNGDTLYNRLGDSSRISSANLSYHQYPSGSGNYPLMSVQAGGLTKYTGNILYHENISPIYRRLDQKENFKIVFEF
jgi:hypothetical protein